MNKAQSLSVNSSKAVLAVISVPRYFVFGLLVLPLTLFIMIWLFNISQLVTVINTYSNELPRILIEGYINLFRFGFHFIPIMLVLISVFQSISLVLVKFMRDNTDKSVKVMRTALLSGLFVAGCVGGAGSIFSPLVTILGLASVLSETSMLSSGFLFLALGIAMYSVYRMGEQASVILSRGESS